MANESIRKQARFYGVPFWRVAEKMGISENTFSRLMRKELPKDKATEIVDIIKDLARGAENDR